MTNEYSPSTDDEFLETKRDFRFTDSNGINVNETVECGDRSDSATIKTGNSIDILRKIPKRTVPNSNVPEKIIICVDVCQPEKFTPFELEQGISLTPLNMLKRITSFFLYSKQSINNNSEFALVILRDSEPLWVHNFTKNIIEIINILDSYDSEECKQKEFNLSLIFDLIYDKVNLPELCSDYKLVPPSNIVRLVLMYNRSNCLPKLASDDKYYDLLKKHPYFLTDILFAHEENCSENQCEEIYDSLQTLDNGYSYIFEVIRSATKLHEYAAKLLAHPFQRPLQRNSSYSFFDIKK